MGRNIDKLIHIELVVSPSDDTSVNSRLNKLLRIIAPISPVRTDYRQTVMQLSVQ